MSAEQGGSPDATRSTTPACRPAETGTELWLESQAEKTHGPVSAGGGGGRGGWGQWPRHPHNLSLDPDAGPPDVRRNEKGSYTQRDRQIHFVIKFANVFWMNLKHDQKINDSLKEIKPLKKKRFS